MVLTQVSISALSQFYAELSEIHITEIFQHLLATRYMGKELEKHPSFRFTIPLRQKLNRGTLGSNTEIMEIRTLV